MSDNIPARASPLAPQPARRYCQVLLESSTGCLIACHLTASECETPAAFMKALGNAYRQGFSKPKWFYYRCILLKKPVVSIATLANLAKSNLTTPPSHEFFVKHFERDKVLTRAIFRPAALANADSRLFFAEYERVFVNPILGYGLDNLQAILIHLEVDPLAVRISRIAGSIISLAIGIGMQLGA